MDAVRKPILFSFSFIKPPTHRILKTPKVKHHMKVIKSLIEITFHLEDDEGRLVSFNGDSITFTVLLKNFCY